MRRTRRVALDVRGLIDRVEIFRLSKGAKRDPAVEGWLSDEPVELRSLAKEWLEHMRRCGDDVRELMHDGCPVACVEDAPFGYVNTFRSHVNVGFFYGALLDDQAGLLEGSGKRMRHVKIKPGAALDTRPAQPDRRRLRRYQNAPRGITSMPRYALLLACLGLGTAQAATFSVTLAPDQAREPLTGRLLLLLSVDPGKEPRLQIQEGTSSQQVFGIDASDWKGNGQLVFDSKALGYPRVSLADVPAGTYRVQALLHRYETFRRKDGHVVQLPMDRGEGQAWSKAPGNLYSTVREIKFDPADQTSIALVLDQVIAPIKPPADTEWVKHERIKSRLLSEFWGRPMYLGAHVLLPKGWAEHPKARYPLMINHGHFPEDFDGFRPEPPDANLPPDYSDRFRLKGYNRVQQELAYQLYQDWTSPGFPRVIAIEIQHANPYYDDSYAVNSENLGPYADAIQQELIPYLERSTVRLARAGRASSTAVRPAVGKHSAVQVKYPDFYNGAFAACPDPIDFRAYGTVNVYEDRNAYMVDAPFKQTPRIAMRDYLGRPTATLEEVNRLELVLGPNSRSGGQWDIWQAVFSPVGADGYPQPIWNKRTR